MFRDHSGVLLFLLSWTLYVITESIFAFNWLSIGVFGQGRGSAIINLSLPRLRRNIILFYVAYRLGCFEQRDEYCFHLDLVFVVEEIGCLHILWNYAERLLRGNLELLLTALSIVWCLSLWDSITVRFRVDELIIDCISFHSFGGACRWSKKWLNAIVLRCST